MMKMEHTVRDLQDTFSKPFKEVADGSHKIGSLSGRWTCVKLLGEKFLWTFNDLANRIKLFAVALFELFSEMISSRKKIAERAADTLDDFALLCLYPFTTTGQILRLIIGCTIYPGIALGEEVDLIKEEKKE